MRLLSQWYGAIEISIYYYYYKQAYSAYPPIYLETRGVQLVSGFRYAPARTGQNDFQRPYSMNPQAQMPTAWLKWFEDACAKELSAQLWALLHVTDSRQGGQYEPPYSRWQTRPDRPLWPVLGMNVRPPGSSGVPLTGYPARVPWLQMVNQTGNQNWPPPTVQQTVNQTVNQTWLPPTNLERFRLFEEALMCGVKFFGKKYLAIYWLDFRRDDVDASLHSPLFENDKCGHAEGYLLNHLGLQLSIISRDRLKSITIMQNASPCSR